MPQVTAQELKVLDPKRFEKEYYQWQEHTGDYFAEGIQEQFTEEMAKFGVRVDDIQYSGFYSQSDYASFDGRVRIAEWMEAVNDMSVTYPALYLALKADGSYAVTHTSHRGRMEFEVREQMNDIEPIGVFSELDQDAWADLVYEQLQASEVEEEVAEWCRGKADELYRTLQAAYEYATSEEMFLESCECNEITFEKD